MATSFTAPVSTPAPAAAPTAAPTAAPASTTAPAVEMFSEGDLTPTLIEDELSAALEGDLPDPEPAAATAAPAATQNTATEPDETAADADTDDAQVDATADAAAAPAATAATAAPTLPEGVRLRQIDGAQKWVMDPKIGESLTARAGLVDAAEKIIGEPLTPDALKFRQDVVEGFEGMRGHLLSDDPADQANVVAHFEEVINGARTRGEIGHDALSGFAKVVVDRALAGDPATAQAVEKHITRTVIDRLYDEALRTHDPVQAKNLWNSAQQADKASFGEYRPLAKFDEGRKAAPPARFQPRQTAAAAPAQSAEPPEARAKAEYRQWHQATNEKIHTGAVTNAVDEALSNIPKEQRDKFPGAFSSTRDQLFKVIAQGLRSDPQLREQVEAAQKRARLAVSPEIRNQITDEIVRRHAARVTQILKDKKGPILSEYAQLVASKSTDQANRVRAGAKAGRNAAPGGGPSASRSNPQPPKTAKFDGVDDLNFGKELEEALAS